jgi:hypothetical protein
MDFSAIFQLKAKKFWWMDVIFYFAISLLIAAVFSYLVFLLKNNFQRQDIQKAQTDLQGLGTDQQKEHEDNVIGYRNKINDFTLLFADHEFASNAFAFMQTQTMPNIWFTQFSLDQKSNTIQLSGEAEDVDALSRQVAVFEKNKYVKSVGALNSSLGDSQRNQFSINLALDQSIFSYLSDMAKILPATLLAEQPAVEPVPENFVNPQDSEKLITSFHILLTPEVAGTIDQENFAVSLDVPFGADVKNLTPAIVISPVATVSPASNIAQDFTNPIDYTVVAKDGSTQNYKVTVNILPKVAEKTSRPGVNVWVVVVIAVAVIAMILVTILFAWKKFKNKKHDI